MIKQYTSNNGYEVFDLTASNGGFVIITYYGCSSDIAQVHISKSADRTTGFSEYVSSLDDVERHVKVINNITWLSDEDKAKLSYHFDYIKAKTTYFLEVRDRFHVFVQEYPVKSIYTFSEKEESAPIAGTSVEIKVSIPSYWSEDEAWKVLFRTLSVQVKPFVKQENN